ncbi:methyltransferase [Hyphomonas sp. FCG-A18]|uniref:tRNA1(Val) (adenine(37)-N6)-methyltransferase n=1 Tax=Hyphomonas sp. FCG-A18 TaxID=3080019 RepID=UPI002B27DECE|nr:methyltransferase [Hyphomonas sp. FCG-A18]
MSEDTLTTVDDFLSGRVQVVQPAKGFRAGTDSVLLAAALNAGARGEALEIGCGAGGALLPAAWRVQGMQFTGLERDLPSAALAVEGVAINNLEDRVMIVEGDAGNLPAEWENRFDLVFSNPPFFEAGKIMEPGQGKQDAYIETLSLKDWLSGMLFAVRPKGTIVMIHRAAELARILSVLERRSGDITVLPVRSAPGEEAKRVLVRARKGLRPGPLKLLAGVDLYQARGGERTQTLEAIAADGAGLVW